MIDMPKVRIKLNSPNIESLNAICNSIKDIAEKSGVSISGPVPLPTQKLKITTRKSPCGNGTATFDRFEMRIHKRLIDFPTNEKILHHIMKMYIPKNVNIKIEMKD
jgi:small subunit ribosomal protein S10